MPRPIPVIFGFGTGEVAETIYTRPDLAKYAQGAQQILNYHNLPQGGVTRRPGLRFVAQVKDATQRTVVRPFEFSRSQAYILELGDLYTRFYHQNARIESSGNPVEVTTVHAAADLYDLDFVQSADVLYALSCNQATRRFERYSDTCWRYKTVTFTPPPTVEYGARPPGHLSVSAVSGTVTVTSNAEPSFYPADEDREIVVVAGDNAGARLGILTYTSGTQVTGVICDAFLSLTATCSGSWKITGSPRTTVTPAAKDPVGKATTLTLALAGWRGTSVLSDTDCGKYAVINGGQYEITCVLSTTVAGATIRGTASAATAAEAGAWTLEEGLWGLTAEYPECGDFFEDRLYLPAGHRICGSKTGDYENFGLGTLDDDAVVFPINSKSINTIRSLIGARQLQVFTVGGEYVARGGGTGDPITPTNIQVGSETTHGTRGVTPVRVADQTLFVSRGGRQLREFTVREDSVSDIFTAPDLLLLAHHLTEDATIIDLAYQREPQSRLWALRSDGVLLCCSYRREENVVAWSRHTTCGQFESVAVIPHPDGDRDQVWVTTVRTIGGSTKRFIEYFDDCAFYYSQLHTDAALTCDNGVGLTCNVMIGLSHLDGATVHVIGDGLDQGTQVVADGNVTVSPAARRVEVGLPYTSLVQTLRPEVAIGGETSQTKKMRWAEVVVRVLRTIGLEARTDVDTATYDVLPFNTTNWTTPYTGELRLTHLGWDCGILTLQQSKPLPSTILLISGVLDLGGA